MPTIKSNERNIKIKLGAISALPPIQAKTAVPNKTMQKILPDSDFYALASVRVEPIPNEYCIPEGNLKITENGEYDVRAYEKVEVTASEGYKLNIEGHTLVFFKEAIIEGNEVFL